MAGGQALVCGNTAHLNGISPPFTFSYPLLQGSCQTEAVREVLTAAVADNRGPLGLDERPQPPHHAEG